MSWIIIFSYFGDCLEVMKRIPDSSVDIVLADLPFGTTNCKWDIIIPFMPLWEQYKRIAKENAPYLLFAQTPFDKVLGCSNIDMLRYEWIWEKHHATGHLNSKKMPMKAHENILVFYKKAPVYNPIKTKGHERKVSLSRHKRNSSKSTIYNANKNTSYDSTERYPRSVLKFPSDKQKYKYHPTQKPVALLEYLIKTYSNENDIVLDNCMGGGSAGIASVNTNRRFIGIEKDEVYFNLAKKRIENQLSQTKLF